MCLYIYNLLLVILSDTQVWNCELIISIEAVCHLAGIGQLLYIITSLFLQLSHFLVGDIVFLLNLFLVGVNSSRWYLVVVLEKIFVEVVVVFIYIQTWVRVKDNGTIKWFLMNIFHLTVLRILESLLVLINNWMPHILNKNIIW